MHVFTEAGDYQKCSSSSQKIEQVFSLKVRFFDPLSHPSTPPDGQRWLGIAVRLFLPFRSVFCQVPSTVIFLLVQSGDLGGLQVMGALGVPLGMMALEPQHSRTAWNCLTQGCFQLSMT